MLAPAMLGAHESTSETERSPGTARAAGNDPISKPGVLRRALERIGLSPISPGDVVYHGFISYSHAADAKLAPALQKGLHRFAKPWYRMRALHIFRDEASLSANPRLWDSIAAALEGSEHLILLASPPAAASQWVGREAEYWCAHKDPSKILICLTDGELSWDDAAGDVDIERERTNALPPALASAFAEEPRYIDLRWTREADRLSLGDRRWRDAVAEIAAPLHHVPKDELSGEDVRQHRRTLRVARSAAVTLLMLLIAAVVLAVVAYSQYRGAQARALAAEATANLQSNPEQALSQALQSTEITADSSGVQALRASLTTAPERMTIQSGAGAGVQAAWSPVGDQLAVSGAEGRLELWRPNGRIERVLPGADGARITQVTYSPSGEWIAVVRSDGNVDVWNALTGNPISTRLLNAQTRADYTGTGNPTTALGDLRGTSIVWNPAAPTSLIVYGSEIGQVLGFDATSGRAGTLITLPPGSSGVTDLVPSPDGTKQFLVVTGASTTGYVFTPAANTAVRLAHPADLSALDGHLACWTGDGRTVVTWDPTEAQDLYLRVWNPVSGREAAEFLAPETITAAACGRGRQLTWAATGTRGGTLTLRLGNGVNFDLPASHRYVTAIASSRDGAYLATAGTDGVARVWQARTGTQVGTLNDGDQLTSVAFNPSDGLVLTTDQRGLVRIWNAGAGQPVTALQLPAGSTYPLGFIADGHRVYGVEVTARPDRYATHPSDVHFSSVAALLWDASSGQLLKRLPLPSDVALAQPDGRHCDVNVNGDYSCTIAPSTGISVPVPTQGYQWGLLGLAASPDGSRLAYATPTGASVIDAAGRQTGAVVLGSAPTGLAFSSRQLMVMSDRDVVLRALRGGGTLRLPAPSPPTDAQFSGDGRRLIVGYVDGEVIVWDTTTGRPLARLRVDSRFVKPVRQLVGGVPLRAQAVTRVAINGDGSEVAAGTSWQSVFLWDVGSPGVLAARMVTSSVDQGLGAAGATTQGGFNGPWPIVTLSFAAGGTRLVATDMPYYSASDSAAPITSVVLSARGTPVASYQSSDLGEGAIAPGDALSPDGRFLLSGPMDLGPDSAGAADTVYQTSTGVPTLGLGTADLAVAAAQLQWPSPAQPWAPNGIDVLAGNAIYACDACAPVPVMQHTARVRLAWRTPLSPGRDHPPPGDPYR